MQKQVLAARNDFVNALFKKLDIDIFFSFYFCSAPTELYMVCRNVQIESDV